MHSSHVLRRTALPPIHELLPGCEYNEESEPGPLIWGDGGKGVQGNRHVPGDRRQTILLLNFLYFYFFTSFGVRPLASSFYHCNLCSSVASSDLYL